MSEREGEQLLQHDHGARPINISNSGDQSSGIRLSATQQVEADAKKKKYIKWGLIGGAITIVVVLAIVLPIVLSNKSSNPDPPGPEPEPEPPGPPPVFYIYNPYNVNHSHSSEDRVVGVIYSPQDYNKTEHDSALRHLTAGLHEDINNITNTSLFVTQPHGIPVGPNNMFIQNISFEFSVYNPNVALLTLTDADNKRFSIPEEVLAKPKGDILMKMDMVGFQMFYDPFGFQFEDIRDPTNVFVHTRNSSLVMMDKYIQMDLQLPSQRMYGFGERVREFQLTEGTWTMWARGADSPYDNGTGSKQVYGVHPFILVQGKNKGDFFGMFFRNSNAQSPLIKFNHTTGGSTLSYITTGGQIEIAFFLHGSAKSIIKQYHNMIGAPELPPLWAFGWNQASWAYNTQTDIETMMQKYTDADIPLDNVWLDITYLDKFTDFTVDTKAYPDLKGLAERLHNNRQQLVVILDAGISADDKENKYYKMAQDLDILIKSGIYNETTEYKGALVMKVWPNHTVFVDWLHPDAAEFWATGLYDLYQQVPYDGLWIDMNEATGFTNGEINVTEKAEVILNHYREKAKRFLDEEPRLIDEWYTTFENQTDISTYFLPFTPGYKSFKYANHSLDYMAMSLNATHPHSGLTEYDLHNLFGLMMAEHTRNFMTNNKTYPGTDIRPFILTRSTFASAGKYASHWLGDNWRDWAYMNYSIAGIMNMNMFGVPHVGADVCGFFGEEMDQEMCARWIQLSTFYPFARSHYNKTWKGEALKSGIEPYNLEGEYLDIGRSAIYDRYQYLRLVYTCVYETMMFGGTCFDPMFFHYPEDDKLFTQIEESFMVAGALKVSPILVPGVKDTYPVYFPKGKWVNMADFSEIVEGPITKDLPVRKTVLTHLRPGSLIPFQDNSDRKVKKTSQLIEKSISIVANRDEFGKATGTLLLEKGSSRSEINGNHHEYYTISIQANSLQKQLTQGSHASQKAYFESLILVNAEDLKDVNFACGFSTHFERLPMTPTYDAAKKTLTITYQPPVPGDHLTFSAFRQINYGVSGKDLNLCEDKQYEYKIKDGYKPDLTKSFETFTLVNQGAYKLPDLNVTLQVIDTNIVNVKWKFQNQPEGYRKQFEVPKSIINVKPTKTTPHLDIYLDIQTEPSFQIHIQNHGGAYVLSIEDMLLDQNLNIIDVYHNTTKGDNFTGIFGLGQKVQKDFFYKDGIYSLWNRDDGTPLENGRPSGNNIYGTHPFYMYKNSKNVWVGVFNNLAAAQDWIVLNNKDLGEVNTTTIAVGGVADMFFIVDATPDTVLSSYLEIVGKPVLIPQWALGWHQCRWGYNTTYALYDMAMGYYENKIPLDTVWSDIDYMYNYRDFTVDPQKFSSLPKLVEELHKRNQQYIPIIDAGIAMRQPGNYTAFDLGVEQDVFIKLNDKIFVGQVWPKDAAYPDFFNDKTHVWWKTELQVMHDYLPFDGLWQDMNEASNFCGGSCYPDQYVADQVKYHLPYTPTGRNLERQSIPLDATHSDGTIELDAHSLYGTMQVQTSHEFFREHKNRTFIVGRSTYAGSGKFASLWLGDNESKPQDMGTSVLGVMQMSMMGIPMVGADICGFGGTTNGELCARWHYVGAFQPFSRNHNNYQSHAQEPYVFAEDMYEPGISYMDIMTDAILTKYSLIRFFYTHLTKLSLDGGSPFYKPLFFEYPNDMNATLNLTQNVMLGDSLKISHLADNTGQNETYFYFPAGTWCNLLRPAEKCFDSKGQAIKLRSKAYDAYAHIREGRIIPFQDAKSLNYQPGKSPLTVRALQDYPIDLHMNGMTDPYSEALWYARGIYINDDGYNLTTEGNVNRYQFIASYVEREDAEKIIITVDVQPALNYLDTKTNCTAINKNDYIHQIFIYDADRLGLTTTPFIAHLHTQEDKDIVISPPVYDQVTDRLVITLDDKTPRCISTIKYIEVQRRT